MLEHRARQMARRMVYLEREAKRALAEGNPDLALVYWTARTEILQTRMLLSRRLWALRRVRSS